jgi:2-polyprenyl-3-methyl-5-hydroxy-6-metoxy-1,4-benzoquinol methylase
MLFRLGAICDRVVRSRELWVTPVQDYANYNLWKSWPEDAFMRVSPIEASAFSADFEGISLQQSRFLDIGFGNGALLSWAQSRGAVIYGVEVLETSLERARKKGIPLLSSDLKDNLPQFSEFFDVIVAYDVLEHLAIPEVIRTLDVMAQMLKPGGKVMLRFPNGQSPFGRFLQHADHTHRSTLSEAILDQMTVSGPLTMSRIKRKVRPVGSLQHRLGAHVKSLVRTFTEWYLKAIFNLNCDLDTNVVIQLTKRV